MSDAASSPASPPPPGSDPTRHFRMPGWIPWLVAALLAVGCARLTQLYIAARTDAVRRSAESAIADISLRSARQQLEAERLIAAHLQAEAKRTLGAAQADLAAAGKLIFAPSPRSIRLLPAPGEAASPSSASLVWDSSASAGCLQTRGLTPPPPDSEYHLCFASRDLPQLVDAGTVAFTVDPAAPLQFFRLAPRGGVQGAFSIRLVRKGLIPVATDPVVLSTRQLAPL